MGKGTDDESNAFTESGISAVSGKWSQGSGGREWDLSTKEEEKMSLGEGKDWIVVV